VGSGPAAVTLAAHLWHRWEGLGDVVLLDAGHRPMQRFFSRVDALNQRVLRSPYEHHMGYQGHRDCELLDFARCHWSRLTDVERGEIRMAMSGQRSVVPLDVFEAYAAHAMLNHEVDARRWTATVTAVTPTRGGWLVEHDRGRITAERVVLAIGEETVDVPTDWKVSARVHRWDRYRPQAGDRVVVVSGSGLSAAHVVADACARGSRVIWVQRGAERYQCADVNARFFRPEGRAAFRRLSIPGRVKALVRHRVPTIMFEFRPLLDRWAHEGCLAAHRFTTIEQVGSRPGRRLRVYLSDGSRHDADVLVAAHGTQPSRLPVGGLETPFGHVPVVSDDRLEPPSMPGLHLLGAHTGLAVGPAARNLDGMRVAAQLVADAFDRPVGSRP
jgi:hypothetical protein